MDAELQQLNTAESGLCAAFAESRIGGRHENQDSFGSKETKHGFLVTVCDGMGGGPGGKTASEIAVREIILGIDEAGSDEELSNLVIKAVRRANMAILAVATQNPQLRGMGSTATVLLVTAEKAYVAHVGDSRVYQIRGKKKVFRTFDHSMVFDLVKQGVITEEQARLSAQSNVITRALGIKPDVEVELNVVPFKKGDRFVLCSDGIHGTMPEVELIKLLADRKNSLGAVTDNISTTVDNQQRENGGGHDNLTIAMVEMSQNSTLKAPMSLLQKSILSSVLAVAVVCAGVVVCQVWPQEDPSETVTVTENQASAGAVNEDSPVVTTDSATVQKKDTSVVSNTEDKPKAVVTAKKDTANNNASGVSTENVPGQKAGETTTTNGSATTGESVPSGKTKPSEE